LDWDLALALGWVTAFRLVLAADFDLAFRDGDLVRPNVRALNLVFALLLVFAFRLVLALALALEYFDFFLTTMRTPSAPNDSQLSRADTIDPIDRPKPVIGICSQTFYHTRSYSENAWRRTFLGSE
jgi:hypothetical protein